MQASPISRFLPFGLMLAAFALHLRFGLAPEGPLVTHALLDTDSYVRLLRIEQLWQGGGWYDNTIYRLGAPEGMPLHWTRPLDLMIMAPAALAVLFGAPDASALWWSALLICPLLHALSCLAAVWAARAVWPRDAAWAAGIILLAQPLELSYGALGRADHHVLILLLSVLSVGAFLRAAVDAGRGGMAWFAGLFAGLAYWIGPEALLVFMPLMAGLGLLFVLGETAMARQGLRAAFGFAGAIGLALLVDVEPGRWLVAEMDRVSIVALALALALAGVFGGVLGFGGSGRLRRLAVGGVLSVLAVGILALLFPGFYKASLAIDDPLMNKVLGEIREMQPIVPWKDGGLADLLASLGGGLVALAVAPLASWRATPGGERRAQILLLLALAGTLAAALGARRFTVEFGAVAAISAAGAFVLVAQAIRDLRPLARGAALIICALAVTTLFPTLGAVLAAKAETPAAEACPVPPLSAFLRDLRPVSAGPDDPVILSDSINISPRLAQETAFRFVGGPYHRGIAAMTDTAAFFAATDDAAAHLILVKRKVSMVVLCLTGPGLRTAAPGTLGARLETGGFPGFLVPLSLPPALSGIYYIFSVQPAAATTR